MTKLAALIPRIRTQHTGRIVAIRCATCRTWRKPRQFNPTANTCHDCVYGEARKRITGRVTRYR